MGKVRPFLATGSSRMQRMHADPQVASPASESACPSEDEGQQEYAGGQGHAGACAHAGTRGYMAPELVRVKELGLAHPKAIDIFRYRCGLAAHAHSSRDCSGTH